MTSPIAASVYYVVTDGRKRKVRWLAGPFTSRQEAKAQVLATAARIGLPGLARVWVKSCGVFANMPTAELDPDGLCQCRDDGVEPCRAHGGA